MRINTQHVRRRLCTLSELRAGPGTPQEERANTIDWTIWNSIRPDSAASDGSVDPLMDLLAEASDSNESPGELAFPTA